MERNSVDTRFCLRQSLPIRSPDNQTGRLSSGDIYSVYFLAARCTRIYWKCPSARNASRLSRRERRILERPKAISVWGIVLLNVSAGKEPEFFSNLGSVQQVRHVFYLFDDFEYLVEVEAETPQEMAKVMTNHIRHLPGVERTATFIEGNMGAVAPVVHPETLEEGMPLW